MKIRLRNKSGSTLNYVTATLNSSFGNVKFENNKVEYSDINSGQAVWPNGKYDMFFDFASTTDVPFSLRVVYEKDNVECYQDWNFTQTIYQDGLLAPKFEVDHVEVDDTGSNGNADTKIQSGERPDFKIWLRNTGTASATNVTVTFCNVTIELVGRVD